MASRALYMSRCEALHLSLIDTGRNSWKRSSKRFWISVRSSVHVVLPV
jgi:hypothetical protein